jgi:hypothetical protein
MEIVQLLVTLALSYARATYPHLALKPAHRRALKRIYHAFVLTLAKILIEERSEHALRQAVAVHTTYHLSGLKAFFLGARPAVMAGGASR